jgi:hypothetical protein
MVRDRIPLRTGNQVFRRSTSISGYWFIEFVGFIGFIGFVEFIEFIEFVGFVGFVGFTMLGSWEAKRLSSY